MHLLDDLDVIGVIDEVADGWEALDLRYELAHKRRLLDEIAAALRSGTVAAGRAVR